MAAKFKNSKMVYSTNPDYNDWEEEKDNVETPNPSKQKLYVFLDKKQRKGKQVTIVEGFVGMDDDLKDLGKKLKSKCGVGGTVKNGEIMLQGDFKTKVFNILVDLGYNCKVKG
ncbi:MAG: translation initiation factor [Lentimicrobiaceae bacterium]|jgi:translation initiation factor 1|nr:translation initiation factor [Lentimicrobiaceae bacterium]MCP4909718.1 translation initiation factor [Bacteroidota bacterium]MBT3454237.1 translation initiation factor [Lentimicrobiaceae bacterium]MBT3817904.1 translation initiation factor [Lentimicrobiaceae bacterium]MBT4060649.1 translation initiation factor [Lentimicrobiaceae bacterium]